jgi:hypothetical protein
VGRAGFRRCALGVQSGIAYHISLMLILLPSDWKPFLIRSGFGYEGVQIYKCFTTTVDSEELGRMKITSNITKLKTSALSILTYSSAVIFVPSSS